MNKQNLKLISVVGARPNFMKIAPIIDAIAKYNSTVDNDNNYVLEHILVHTGQHYDEKMSHFFFNELGIPKPDINLEVGSSSHATQTAEIIIRFEKVCVEKKPTHVLVVGDVNSTIACALVAVKLGIKIIHVEAGLRSYDRTMPEEINRVLTDAITDIFFTTEKSANDNLLKEGIPAEKIFFVGNVMIDTLLKHRSKADNSRILETLGLCHNKSSEITPYCVLTLHRPSNVDNISTFKEILTAIKEISNDLPVIFPLHPRTKGRIKEFNFHNYIENLPTSGNAIKTIQTNGIFTTDPLSYLDFIKLMSHAKLLLTDSGGIQEESTILGIPCVTLRENTERPVTLEFGTNILAGTNKENIIKTSKKQLSEFNDIMPPPLWDGNAADRMINILTKI